MLNDFDASGQMFIGRSWYVYAFDMGVMSIKKRTDNRGNQQPLKVVVKFGPAVR